MSDYISYNGKKLRKGYTTGTCATAATMAAIQLLTSKKELHQVQLTVPEGTTLIIPVHNHYTDNNYAECSVIKDGGDDADATHGLHIYSRVSWRNDSNIVIDGGTGVGRITREGLKSPVGEAAINPTPRKMLTEEARKLIGDDRGLNIVISVPEGEEVAKGTMNPRLGIQGGISILGTSGIVRPMSEESWKQAITIEMEMKKNIGLNKIILTPGNYGRDFIKDQTAISDEYVVEMSNFVGYVLKEVQRLQFDEVIIVGHLGKLIKLAGGIFSTHSKDADARSEIMVANLALMGAPLSLLKAVENCATTEEQANLIMDAGFGGVYQILCDKIKERSYRYIKYRHPNVKMDVITFLNSVDLIISTEKLEELERVWR